ncbi:flavin-containing monooxygenase [Longivirga aurantiaca]|uniref:Flavin-containing monooxygenase n=1 Tax=Longivirga aurantiaca TaxID=1837743 RepID=A0ABW1SVT8_9ACTN
MTGHDENLDLDVVVVGAGFSGLYMLHRLRGLGLRTRVIERAPSVGGTWYWNRYPGARCDIESIDYQYSFSEELLREWRWSERYAAQPEILAYLEHVADRFDLRRDITFSTSVTSAVYDEAAACWMVTTDAGEVLSARWCVMATGNLSVVQPPRIPGLDSFRGRWLHTGEWPTEPVDLAGKRVAVVGTGSSGIQAVPVIARTAAMVHVLQRTPNYSMPAHNRPLASEEIEEAVRTFAERRRICEWSDAGTPLAPPTTRAVDATPEERRARYEEGWKRGGISSLSFAFTDMFTDEVANGYAQDFAREQIRSIVHDPRTAELLSPTHHIGTKRTCTDTGYFETYNRDNVELVDVRTDPIVEITPDGIRTRDRQIDVDVIVFAIGFDAITGALAEIDLRGRDGVRLRDAWAEGPQTYLGLQTAGFPNLFLITGPGSPSVLSNMVVSIEQHVDWVADCIDRLRADGLDTIEPTLEAQQAWMRHVDELAQPTLYPRATSWYLGTNIPGKPRVFNVYVAGCGPYRQECDDVVAAGYRGFVRGRQGNESQRSGS